jgi:hypothetical protein
VTCICHIYALGTIFGIRVVYVVKSLYVPERRNADIRSQYVILDFTKHQACA